MNERMRRGKERIERKNQGTDPKNVIEEFSFADGADCFLFHVIRCQRHCAKKKNKCIYICILIIYNQSLINYIANNILGS